MFCSFDLFQKLKFQFGIDIRYYLSTASPRSLGSSSSRAIDPLENLEYLTIRVSKNVRPTQNHQRLAKNEQTVSKD